MPIRVAASPGCRLPCSRHPRAGSPGAGPLGLQGRQPIRVSGGAASPRCRLPWPPVLGGPSPLYIVPPIEQYGHPIPLQSISSDRFDYKSACISECSLDHCTASVGATLVFRLYSEHQLNCQCSILHCSSPGNSVLYIWGMVAESGAGTR
jgi:hypothetical protein